MTYRYHSIGKYQVCVDQSISGAIKTILLGYERYRLRSIGVTRPAARKAIQIVARDKLGLLSSTRQVVLPVFGQIAMQVHGGYKIFDFNRLEVSKSFSRETTSQEASREIAAGTQVSGIAAAPRFLAADPELRWYKEEYICGVHAADPVYRSGKSVADFYPDVEDCLADLASCESALSMATLSHIDRLADLSFRASWLESGVESADIDAIEAYAQQLRDWLAAHSQQDQIQLVLTHGDFSLVNAIATETGLRFIDWEGIARGGLFSDVFNFLFVERYYGRADANFLKHLSFYIDSYREHVVSRHPGLKEAANLDRTFARRLYYLERLNLLLQRKASENLHSVVHKSIEMFLAADHEIGDVSSQDTSS